MSFISKSINIFIKTFRVAKSVNLRDTGSYHKRDQKILISNLKFDVFFTFFSYITGVFLARKGYEVLLLSDDCLLYHYDNIKDPNLLDRDQKKYFRQKKINAIAKRLLLYIAGFRNREGIKFIFLSELLKRKEVIALGNVNIGDCDDQDKNFQASHKRFFHGREFCFKNERHQKFLRMCIYNRDTLKDAFCKLLDYEQIALGIMLDGNGVTGGVPRDLFEESQKKYLTYLPTEWRDHSIIITRLPLAVDNVSTYWEKYLEELDQESLEFGKSYLEKRVKDFSDDLSTIEEQFFSSIRAKQSQFNGMVVIYPNLTWDGVISERDKFFNNPDAWILETYDFCKENNLIFILKEHPFKNYTADCSSYAVLRELRSDFGEYSGFFLIRGDEKISPYKIAQNLPVLNLVYNGTLICELAYLKKPVLISGNSPYCKKNVGFEVNSKNEYFNFIKEFSYQDLSEDNRKNAIIAAGYQFNYNVFYYPIMPKIADFRKVDKYWRYLDFRDLDFERSAEFQKTINRFEFEILN